MVTQPFPWMWTMLGLETGPSTRLLPHNPPPISFSPSTSLTQITNPVFFFLFLPKPKQLLLLHHFLFCPILFTAGPKKSLVSITWFFHYFFRQSGCFSLSVCWLIVSQALLRPCLLKAGTLMLRNNDIDKLLTETDRITTDVVNHLWHHENFQMGHEHGFSSAITSWLS